MEETASDKARAHMTRVAEKITGKKYCTSCQSERSPEGGHTRQTRNGTRWQCASCAARARERGVI